MFKVWFRVVHLAPARDDIHLARSTMPQNPIRTIGFF
jgi:hypothetical protein